MKLTLLDRLNLARLWLRTNIAEYRRWRRRTSAFSVPRVFYGFDTLPSQAQQAGGGIIKVQEMQSRFRNCSQDANIVYLISSALPYFPLSLVRYARKSNARIVLNQNGVAYPAWFGTGWKEFNRSLSKLLHQSDFDIYQSEFCKLSADKFLGPRNERYAILHNPVDTAVFRPLTASGKPGDGITLLLAGSHQSWYRVKVAIETLKIVLRDYPDANLLIAGYCAWDRNKRQAVEQLREHLGASGMEKHVEYIGTYSQQEAPAILNKAHILLHTKYNDPCPRLVVEAMACGLPVVYSATGGVRELVGDEAGAGVPGPMDWEREHPPDPREMAAGVIRVLRNYQEFSRTARKRAVEKFDISQWLDEHENIFTQLIQDKK